MFERNLYHGHGGANIWDPFTSLKRLSNNGNEIHEIETDFAIGGCISR